MKHKIVKTKKEFITKKIKIPKGYKASELVGDDSSGVIVFDKKKRDKNERKNFRKTNR